MRPIIFYNTSNSIKSRLIKVGFGIFDFCTHSRRLISKNRFPHPISVADAICGTRFDLLILFDILDFWCQLVVIRFVKTLSKRRMFVSSMKISACWLLHRLIKFNKFCWEKRPAKPRPNLRTSLCRRDLKNTKPHLINGNRGIQSWISKLCFLISWNYKMEVVWSRDSCNEIFIPGRS